MKWPIQTIAELTMRLLMPPAFISSPASMKKGTAISGTWDGATVASTELDQTRLADAQSIARALSALQRNSQVRDAVQASDSLRAYLADNREQIGGLQNSSGLTADSLNQLDMVDNLFGTIKSQLDVSAELKPALGNLQIPLAKLALLDPRFFVDQSHSARNVVDKLSRLASSANFPNKVLESRINNIVDGIICDYENDASVFDTALDKIEKLLTLMNTSDRTSAQVKQLAQAHAADLEIRIGQMQSMHDTLSRLAKSCKGDHRPDCPILDSLAREES